MVFEKLRGEFVTWRKCMGIEPTWDRLHSPTPDLKSGSPTSELGTSPNVLQCNQSQGF
jgi:hypothetical protein